MTNRSLPDFMMLSRFFQSADVSELEEALTFDADARNLPLSGRKLHVVPLSRHEPGDKGASKA